jgi:hypothetical protein
MRIDTSTAPIRAFHLRTYAFTGREVCFFYLGIGEMPSPFELLIL